MALILPGWNRELETFRNNNRNECFEDIGKEYLHNHHMLYGLTDANANKVSSGMDSANAPKHASLYQDSSLSNSSDATSPTPTSSIPTCVVAPTANDLHKLSGDEKNNFIPSRKQREFIPENRKDDQYWEKRRKNNEAARKSREKRRVHDVVLENRIMELTRDNCQLRNELYAIKKKFGIPLNETITADNDNGSVRQTESSEKSVSPPAGKTATSVLGEGSYMMSNRPSPSLHLSNNQPPTMVPIQSAIPLPIALQGNYNTKGSLPCYIAASTSEHFHGKVFSNSTANSSSSSNTEHAQSPTPALSQSSKRFSENESSFVSDDGKFFGTSGKSSDTQGNQSRHYTSSTTSHPVSIPYSPSQMAATSSVQAFDNHCSSLKVNTHLSTDEFSDDNYSQDEPLSLTVRKRVDSFSGNESSNSYSSADSPVSQSPPSMALPHKLRHKMPADFGSHGLYSNSVINGLTQLSEIALAQSGPLPLIKKPRTDRSDTGSDGSRSGIHSRSMIDPKYAERRRRNNEAARKCRENRKTLTRIREAKSDYLETENGKLRSELDQLQEEMKQLKEMIDRKRMERNKDTAVEEASPRDDIKQEELDFH